jgi:hypothetical protein
MKEHPKMVAQTLPRGRMPKGEGLCCQFGALRHEGDPTRSRSHCLASQPLGKWFGLVDLVREVLAGALLNNGHVIS